MMGSVAYHSKVEVVKFNLNYILYSLALELFFHKLIREIRNKLCYF